MLGCKQWAVLALMTGLLSTEPAMAELPLRAEGLAAGPVRSSPTYPRLLGHPNELFRTRKNPQSVSFCGF